MTDRPEQDGTEQKKRAAQRQDEAGQAEERPAKAQDASGGAKEEFETAADDNEGWRAIAHGFEEEGRDQGPDIGQDPGAGDDSLPADARMNAESRGADPRKEEDAA